MGAAEVLSITDYRPYLSEKSIEMIVDRIVSDIDVHNESRKQLEVPTANGFMVEVHVKYSGYNYRRIILDYLEVHLCDEDKGGYKITDECEEAKELINDLLNDRIYDLNSKEEEIFESKEEFAEYWS